MSALVLEEIRRRFGAGRHAVVALDGVSLTLRPGEIVGLVGESGSGKTTLGRIAVGLDRPQAGEVRYGGAPLLDRRGRMAPATRRQIQLVFQDPLASFNPRQSVGASVALPLRAQRLAPRHALRSRAADLLAQVGLDPGLVDRRPHMLSGGQLQRAALARALALAPKLLVCDEPVAALDVSVRAQILNLLLALRERGIGILFVTHDLGVVRRIADRVAVMHRGKVVEEGPSESVWARPQHAYTKLLAASVPTNAGRWRERRVTR